MKKIFVSQLLVEVESLKEFLDRANIPCTIKNQYGSSLAGEVPFVEVFPELWVLRDEDFPKATDVLEDWQKAKPVEASAWICNVCGEHHAKEFAMCWKCGNEKSGT